MKSKLIGKVYFGNSELKIDFYNIKDFLRSDYILYRDAKESYELYYRDELVEVNDDLSFTEIEEAIHSKMNIIDKKLG